jgi:hypothetical protein
MEVFMTLFDKLYSASEEATKRIKKPFVQNKVNRALDGAADSCDLQEINTQEKIDDLTSKLVNGDTSVIGNLIELRLDLAEIDVQASEAKKIKCELSATVAE